MAIKDGDDDDHVVLQWLLGLFGREGERTIRLGGLLPELDMTKWTRNRMVEGVAVPPCMPSSLGDIVSFT